MDKKDIEELRDKVSCGALLEQDRWLIDLKESTRRAVKYRRSEGEIVIVIHHGMGWFDPLSDAKGDLFRLAEHLGADGFGEALARVGEAVGFVPSAPAWKHPPRESSAESLDARWRCRPVPRPGSAAWRYLADARQIPEVILHAAVAAGVLREGPHGSMWAAHRDAGGRLIGWEERGPHWRGFATGGTKELFRFGPIDALRIYVTEAAIDAMSLAALERQRPDTLYVSTGGGWSPSANATIAGLAGRQDRELVAATDANRQGDAYAERIRAYAEDAGCRYSRLRPGAEDWNDQLRGQRPGEERTEGGKPTAACPAAASREAPPAARPLTRRPGEAAARRGDEKA